MNTNGSPSPPTSMPNESSSVQDVTQDAESPNSSTEANTALSKKFPVVEIFGPVIQGEGSQAGQQTMFIRFGGCDYRCQKCDSLHAVMPQAIQKHAKYLTATEIADTLLQAKMNTGVKWVTFSGGNPCMHKLAELVQWLRNDGWFINVETQGTLWQDWLYNCTMITVSPKSMGMGETFEQAKFQKFLLKLHGQRPLCVKVVVFSAQDLEFALHVQSIVEDTYTNHFTHNFTSATQGGVSYYLSLGNPYPPVLNDDLDLVDIPVPSHEDPSHACSPYYARVASLLRSYRELSEEVLQDPRLKDFRFLPQLHVLVYGNESER